MKPDSESAPAGKLDYEPGFKPPRMVRWFHPIEITRTAIKAILAEVITSFFDPRDSQYGDPVVSEPPTQKGESFIDLSKAGGKEPDFWFDFVADVGEGFDATYTVASLLSLPELAVEGVSERKLPRGQLLVMGGDMVYPFPTKRGYRDRLRRPFAWALRQVDPPESAPTLVAIPGNHDWYDGLNNFLKVFCQGRQIGGWKTRQGRSYFAVKLPHRWWVWGNDIQLESNVDRRQIEYFRGLPLGEDPKDPEEKVILCTSKAAWLSDPSGPSDAKKALRYFEERVVRRARQNEAPEGAKLPLVLTGDIHFYTRYQREDRGCQRIIAGGGGAYIRGTHDLPDQVRLQEKLEPKAESVAYDRTGFRYPDAMTSRRLALRALLFPFLQPNFWYCIGVGLLLALVAGSVEWVSRLDGGVSFISLLAFRATRVAYVFASDLLSGLRQFVQDFQAVLGVLAQLTVRHPWITILPVLTLVGTMLFASMANRGRRWTKWLVGLAHWVVEASLALVVLWIMSYVVDVRLDPGSDFWTVGLVLGGLFLLGGFGAGAGMGAYLVVTNRWFGWHNNEVFSCQAIADYRSFLKIHVEEDKLTVYPIGVEKVPKQWRQRRQGEPRTKKVERVISDTPALEPTEDPIRAFLIEGPIVYQNGEWR